MKIHPSRKLTLSLSALLSLTSFGWAQSSDSEEEVLTLPVFQVVDEAEGYRSTIAEGATRVPAKIVDTPLSIQVVSDEFLEDLSVQNLTDAFDYTSGVSVDPENVVRNDAFRIRGFEAGFVLRNGYTKYYAVNLDGVEKVEVVKGPVAALYGRAEPGGVINYTTKEALFTPFNEIFVRVGSHNSYKTGIDTTGPIYKGDNGTGLAYRVIATYLNEEAFKEYVHSERAYFLGNLIWRPLENMSIKAEYEYDYWDREGGINPALVGSPEYFRDYYEDEGRTYGYARNYPNETRSYEDYYQSQNQFLTSIDDSTRPDPADPSDTVPLTGVNNDGLAIYNVDEFIRYPVPGYDFQGYRGINPRWNGDVDYAVDFYESQGITLPDSVISEMRSYSQANQNVVPEYQRNVALPFQFPILTQGLNAIGDEFDYTDPSELNNSGWQEAPNLSTRVVGNNAADALTNARHILYSWSTLKWMEDGMPGDINTTSAYGAQQASLYPKGYEFNVNGPGGFHINESHIATLEFEWKPAEWVDLRYGGSFSETTYRHFQQHNSDTDMDGFTIDPVQNFPNPPISGTIDNGPISKAHTDLFYNGRYVHQFDAVFSFDVGETSHRILTTYEHRDDTFKQYRLGAKGLLDLYEITRDFGSPRAVKVNGNYDIYYDDQPDFYQYYDGTYNYNATGSTAHSEDGYGIFYQGQYLDDGRLKFSTGVRHETRENYDLDSNGDRLTNSDADKEHGTTPMVGVNFRLPFLDNEPISLFASYSESFQPQNETNRITYHVNALEDIGESDSLAAQGITPENASEYVIYPLEGEDNYQVRPVSRVQPEVGSGYEAGFKVDGEKLSGTFTLFHLEKAQIVGSDSTTNALIVSSWARRDPNIAFSPNLSTNNGTQVVEGAEVDMLYEPIEGLQLVFALSYYWTRELANPNPVEYRGNLTVAPGTDGGPANHPSLYTEDYKVLYTEQATYDRDGAVDGYAWRPAVTGDNNVIPVDNNGNPLLTASGQAKIDNGGSLSDLNRQDIRWEDRVLNRDANGDPMVRPKIDGELDNTSVFGDPVRQPLQWDVLAGVPELKASMWSRYDFNLETAPMDWMQHLGVGFGVTYTSEIRPSQSRRVAWTSPSHFIFDGALYYKIPLGDNELRLQLNVNNIFDRRVAGGNFGVTPPREFYLTAKYQF